MANAPKAPGFGHHAAAAKAAHAAGNFQGAMQHAGHMLRIAKSAAQGQPAPLSGQDMDADDTQPVASTPPQPPQATMMASKPAPSGSGNWMGSAVKHPGALHQSLGVPQGQTIPKAKIAKAAESSSPLLAKRAKLAETFAKFRGGK